MKECLCCGDATPTDFCETCAQRPDALRAAEDNALARAYEEWCDAEEDD